MSIAVDKCTYCRKDVWGKYLKMKKKKPYHTFCIVREQRAAHTKSFRRASYLRG